MRDEEYIFYQDVREKKVTGYSARKQRSHCGKGGRVKLPSDYLTKKELKKMSGECVSYRLNEPMKWAEFKKMPDDIQIAYIKAIKEKYNAPNVAIAKMFGVDDSCVGKRLEELGFKKGKAGRTRWEKMAFADWCYGTAVAEEVESEAVEEEVAVAELEQEDTTAIQPCETEEAAAKKKEHERMLAWENRLKKAIPSTGSMTFEDKADNVLLTLSSLLGNKKVCIHFEWTVVEE